MHHETSTVSSGDIEAANQLLAEAETTSDVATLREMLADQNGGDTTIKFEGGDSIEVVNIGTERFAELGQQALKRAAESTPLSDQHWRNKEQ